MRDHFAARFHAFAVEDLALAPEDCLVEAASEVYDVGRFDELLARHPFAADELVWLDRFEQRQID